MMVSVLLIPVAIALVVGLVVLVAYFIKTTTGAKGAMDEGRCQQEELKREIEADETPDDSQV